MTNLILKHYFLEETERLKMEEVLLKTSSGYEEEILKMDDESLENMYNKMIDEHTFC